jgi:hypothetical protein
MAPHSRRLYTTAQSQCTGIPHWLIRLYILTTTSSKITTQCPFFAPGLCLTVVDIKFAVKQMSQF